METDKIMETDLGKQLQIMSTGNSWVPLDSLIPKINKQFKKYNAALPKPTETELPPIKKDMVTMKSLL